jgi:transcriptional repressor NrdR
VQCPYCGSQDSNVVETRDAAEGLRRRRTCGSCKRRFTTYEKVGSPQVMVRKRDGRSERFESSKLRLALERVSRHRPGVRPDDLARVVRAVEAELADTSRKQVAWHEIVTAALRLLQPIDRVAAARFAANYSDEGGTLRLDDVAPEPGTPPQLGLFASADPDDE